MPYKKYKIKENLTTTNSNVVQLENNMFINISINKDNISELIVNNTHTKKYIKAGNYMNFTEHSQKLSPYDIKLTSPYFLIASVEYTNDRIPTLIQKIWNWFKFKFEIEINIIYRED